MKHLYLQPPIISTQIIPYFGLLFTCFEMCKQVCLYRNGYIVSPLSYKLAPGVDQSLGPYELEELKRRLKNRNIGSGGSSVGNRWWKVTQEEVLWRDTDCWALWTGKISYLLDWNTSEACVYNIYILCFRFHVLISVQNLQFYLFHNIILSDSIICLWNVYSFIMSFQKYF